MSDIRSVAVAKNVGCPFCFCGVGMTGADVAGLKVFELLRCAEFIGLEIKSVYPVTDRDVSDGAYHVGNSEETL